MKLLIDEAPLKHFLKLFGPEEKVDLIELGDTWHPSNGFVDGSILGEIDNVRQIMNFDYDFKVVYSK